MRKMHKASSLTVVTLRLGNNCKIHCKVKGHLWKRVRAGTKCRVGKEFIEAYLAGRSEVVVVDWWGSYYLPLKLYV